MHPAVSGLLWGLLSAVSLPLGCALGLWKDLGSKACALMMAFGGGSLLFALTLELFAEAIHDHDPEHHYDILMVMAPCAIGGGLLFFTLDHFIAHWGSFLRKISTKTQYLANAPYNIRKTLMQSTSLHKNNPTEWTRLLDDVDSNDDEFVFVPKRQVKRKPNVYRDEDARHGEEKTEHSPLHVKHDGESHGDEQEFKLKAHSSKQVGIAIWVGILIDGIPESIIIGILAGSPDGISFSLILGVFLSNFPEALSSSIEMQRQGMSKLKIFLMWASLCIFTGIGSMLAAALFPTNPTRSLTLLSMGIEGVAGGAMLTMIAQTMLPEAYENGGELSGMATLLGFLAALSVKIVGDKL